MPAVSLSRATLPQPSEGRHTGLPPLRIRSDTRWPEKARWRVRKTKGDHKSNPGNNSPIAQARATPRMPADDYAAGAANMFDEMDARDGLHDPTIEFVHLLDDNTIAVDQALVGDYSYSELDGGVHGHSEKEDGVKEVDKGVFDQEQ
ncbi:putative galacturonosyltransferase 14 [Hordeum vulgare]|nr:putative galacturonosyltransferase 14 [Hordeum vulgare]